MESETEEMEAEEGKEKVEDAKEEEEASGKENKANFRVADKNYGFYSSQLKTVDASPHRRFRQAWRGTGAPGVVRSFCAARSAVLLRGLAPVLCSVSARRGGAPVQCFCAVLYRCSVVFLRGVLTDAPRYFV